MLPVRPAVVATMSVAATDATIAIARKNFLIIFICPDTCRAQLLDVFSEYVNDTVYVHATFKTVVRSEFGCGYIIDSSLIE